MLCSTFTACCGLRRYCCTGSGLTSIGKLIGRLAWQGGLGEVFVRLILMLVPVGPERELLRASGDTTVIKLLWMYAKGIALLSGFGLYYLAINL